MRSLITPSSVPSSSQARWHCGGGWFSPAGRLRYFPDALLVLPLPVQARCEIAVSEFRSAALAGASLIAGAVLAGTYRAVGALSHRVFVITEEVGLSVVSMCLRSLFHADQSGLELRACGPRKMSIRYAK